MSDKREDFLIRYAHDFAPFIVARASGSWIETTQGQRILDFTSGQICSTIGHNHPHISAAVQRSLEEVIHHQYRGRGKRRCFPHGTTIVGNGTGD